MSTIHMDTDHTRNIASWLNRQANSMDQYTWELQHARRKLTWAWHGGRSHWYIEDFGRIIRQLEQEFQQLEYLSSRLFHEADEWEAVDNRHPFNFMDFNLYPYPGIPGIPGWPSIPFLPALPWLPWRPFLPGDSGFPIQPWFGGISLLPFLMTPGALPAALLIHTMDSVAISSKKGFTLEGALLTWKSGSGWSQEKPKLGIGAKWTLAEGQAYDADDATGDVRIGSTDIGDFRGDAKTLKHEVGVKIKVDEDGKLTAGAFGEFTTVEATGVAVIGGSMLGLAGHGTVSAGSAEGFVGIKDNTLGAMVGFSVASAEVGAGLNVAGANVGIEAGISLGLKFGFKLGPETEIKFGPFEVGLNFGKAESA